MPGAIFGKCDEYMKLDRDKSTFKSHRDFWYYVKKKDS